MTCHLTMVNAAAIWSVGDNTHVHVQLEGGDGEPDALEVLKCWWTLICHQGRKLKGENDVYDGQQGQQDDSYIARGDCTAS